ncbi:MAG TPA: Arc family DNA-binding protein [Burkholderiaceae bacterium]|nr:Arc family DNA-binding protein [Burkholderiaceae bacterium]
MPTLVVKNLPEPLHERLKEQARQHHRSMNKEVVALIEQGLLAPRSTLAPARPLPPLVRLPTGPVTTEWIEAAITEGRD